MSPPPAPAGGRADDAARRTQSGPRPRTTPRAELARSPRFAEVSPAVGQLDEDALGTAMGEDADAALALLAALVSATDEQLRAKARRLAGRLVLDQAKRGVSHGRGVGRPRSVPADRGGDLDLDASADALLGAHAAGRAPGLDELVSREWGRPELALCLLVDASGSMTGARLATAALAAAACALRAPREHAVVTFARQVDVLRPLHDERPPDRVVDELLRLRGHGATALAGALREASDQLRRSRAVRRVTVLLSDCRATDGEDPVPAARTTDELLVLVPVDDPDAAAELVRMAGGRWATVSGAADVPAALTELLGDPATRS